MARHLHLGALLVESGPHAAAWRGDRMNRRQLIATLAALPASSFAASRRLRIGFQKGGLLLLVKLRGSLEKALPHVQIEWKEFATGPTLLEALDAGAIDFGVTGAPPPVFAQAAGRDFVAVAAEPGLPHSEALAVRGDSPIRTVAQLRGKRIAFARGSSSHYLLLGALQQAGLRIADVTPVLLGPAEARAAFESGAIDAWVVWDPYLSILQAAQPLRLLADYGALAPAISPPWSFYEARRAFAEAEGPLLGQVIKALATEGAWATANPEAVARIVAPVLGLGEDVVLPMQRRARFGAVPVTAAIAADQQRVADAFHAHGLIPKPLEVRDNFWFGRGR